jgi:hypothetical protein
MGISVLLRVPKKGIIPERPRRACKTSKRGESMTGKNKLLWPYSTRAALLAAILIWGVMIFGVGVLESVLEWSDLKSKYVLLAVLLAGVVPLALLVLDRLIGSRAVVDIKGIKLDFRQAGLERAAIALPENVGHPEPVIADSSPMQVIAALETATAHQVVRLDLHEGNSWWVTRLLALCAGAAQAGSPNAIVFVGTKECLENSFLGWAPPSSLLRALRDDPRGHGPSAITYGQVYQKATWLAHQLAQGPPPPQVPAPPQPSVVPAAAGATGTPPPPNPEVKRYYDNPQYRERGINALPQIVMDLCAQYQLEKPPDRLTLARLNEAFGHCLSRVTIDLEKDKEEQFAALLGTEVSYVGLVRNGRYEGLLSPTLIERHLLRGLLKTDRQ